MMRNRIGCLKKKFQRAQHKFEFLGYLRTNKDELPKSKKTIEEELSRTIQVILEVKYTVCAGMMGSVARTTEPLKAESPALGRSEISNRFSRIRNRMSPGI